MKRARIVAGILPLVLLAACAKTPLPPPATDTSADQAALRGLTDTFLKAYNAGDLAYIGADYLEDAVEMREDGPELVGKTAIMAEVTKGFAENTLSQTATVDEVAVWGDIGMSRGTWQVTTTPKKVGSKAVTAHGKWLVLHKRAADSSWKAWRHIWNTDRSASEPGK